MVKRIVPSRTDQAGESPRDDEVILVALRAISASDEPAGCWRVGDALAEVGIAAGESTVGRLLRELDRRGLTSQAGTKKGRVLTEFGRSELAALEAERALSSHDDALLRVIRAEGVEEVLQLLHVRRVIEAESASLAAQRATDADVQEIEQAALRHIDNVSAGGDPVDAGWDVHMAIARASKSRVLQIVVAGLTQDRQLHELQTRILVLGAGPDPGGHVAIVEAIRDRRPARAAAAMRAHIDRMIRAVEGSELGKTTNGAAVVAVDAAIVGQEG